MEPCGQPLNAADGVKVVEYWARKWPGGWSPRRRLVV